jgi:hypothetical protein
MDVPIAGRAANLVGENSYFVTRCAQTSGRDDQVTLGAASERVETPRQ